MKYNTIKLKNYLHIHEEYTAAAGITPGMLVELNSAGTLQKHSGAGKTALVMFATEDALQGKGIDDAYAAGDKVQVWVPQRGDIVYALLADEQTVAIGDFVESNGAGFLRKEVRSNDSWESADLTGSHIMYDGHLVGQVLEAKDLSSLEGSESSATTAATTQYVQIRVI